jgi:hypothetical protein
MDTTETTTGMTPRQKKIKNTLTTILFGCFVVGLLLRFFYINEEDHRSRKLRDAIMQEQKQQIDSLIALQEVRDRQLQESESRIIQAVSEIQVIENNQTHKYNETQFFLLNLRSDTSLVDPAFARAVAKFDSLRQVSIVVRPKGETQVRE